MRFPMIHRFGDFELDDQLFELRKASAREIVPIQPKAFDILRCLVEKQDVVVSRAELMAKVWPGVVVTNDSLAQAIMAARAAIGDDGEEPTFIHTVRGRGYRFVGRVEAVSRAEPVRAAEGGSANYAPSSLVGRGPSLAALRDALDGARLGRGGVCLVTGETGVGKTRLVEELSAIAEGVRSVLVSCDGPDGAPGLWPFTQAVRELRSAGVPVGPELDALAEGRVPASTLADPQARFTLFDATTRALTTCAKLRPLLLVIDDLHLADLDTLRLLALLSPQLRTAHMLLVAAYSSVTPRLPSFRAAMSALAQEPSTSVLRLEPLTRDEVGAVVEQANGRALSPALVDKVFEKTKGNPLLVTQLAHVLKSEERVGSGGMATSVLVGGEGIRDTITGMLATLPESANRVLDVAAVFGTTFPLAPLAAALDQSNEHVLGQLDAADVARIVVRAGPASYRFTYPLVRDVIYKRLLSSERARIHGRVASALEKHLGDAPDHQSVAEIADHLVEAAAAGDVNAAVDCSLRAAELANVAGDPEAASRYAQRGLEAFRFAQTPDNARRAALCTLRDAAPSRK
jgi:predicted ATPase/DNA-binding winged helix-turn-helix (wHTH) protein